MFLTPVVTFFLLRDWDKMIAGIEKLLPRQDAPAVKEIAHEIDWTISGYLRGMLIVLLIVSAFYMVALGAIGLNYGLVIGLGAGLISFVPYLGSTSGFLVSGGVAISQFWPDYTRIGACLRHLRAWSAHRRQRADAENRGRQGAAASGLDAFRLDRIRLSLRLHWPSDFGADGRGHRGSGAFRRPQVL